NKNNTSLYYNNSVDAWAVGVFAYELIVGFPPFAGENQLDSVDKIIHSTPAFPEKISELAKAFITAALKKHPGDRPTVIEMLHNPWIRSYQRRTSVLIPQHALRRRSSVSYNSNAAAAPPATVLPAHLDAHGLTPTASMKQHGVGAPHAADAMSPQEIEAMIHRLQIGQ
ncbi:protein kinase domain-containing protein, partial [Haematococcus lacustris]